MDNRDVTGRGWIGAIGTVVGVLLVSVMHVGHQDTGAPALLTGIFICMFAYEIHRG